MTRKGPGSIGLAELEAALDTYGADRTRWPAPLRHALSGLIGADAKAAKLLKAAEAFDKLLDAAPGYDGRKLDRLAGKILEAAEKGADVVPLRRPVRRGLFGGSDYGIAAAALAASLLLGVFVGQSNVVSPAADLLISADASAASGNSTQTALGDDSDSLLYEDLL